MSPLIYHLPAANPRPRTPRPQNTRVNERNIRRAAERKQRTLSNKISPSQQVANQANAQHSTGPRTPEGQVISSQNNLRQGLAGIFRVLPTEDALVFEQLLTGLRDEHHPQSATEDILVDGLAQHHWLAQRALRLQDELFASQDLSSPAIQKQLALYIRYQTTNERAFHKCLTELIKLRKATGCTQNGFVSQNRRQPDFIDEVEPFFGPGHPEFDAVTERVLAEYDANLQQEAHPEAKSEPKN